MERKKSNSKSDEIDLTELVSIIIRHKLIFVIITIISISLGYFYSSQKKPLYLVQTEIRSISDLDEFRYQTYNSYINKKFTILTGEDSEKVISIFNNFIRIDRHYLIKLVFDRLNDQTSINNLLKKSGYLNQEDYQSFREYEIAIDNLSRSIKIKLPEENLNFKRFFIETKVSDIKKWKKLLIFIDEYLNNDIRENLNNHFYNQIYSEELLKNYQIEDLKQEILKLEKNIEDKDNKNYIYELREQVSKKKIIRENLILNKDIERMKILFANTPIMNQNEFFAAKVLHSTSYFENINRVDQRAVIIVFGLLGLLISCFFVYFLNNFKNRK